MPFGLGGLLAYWSALQPHSSGGAYVNFLMDDEGDDRITARGIRTAGLIRLKV